MVDLKQKIRWSESELELIRNTFSGEGERKLYEIRDVLFQLSDKVPTLNEDVLKIVRKMILPELDIELPLGLQADIRNALSGNPQKAGIGDLHPEIATLHIKVNDLVYEYLNQRLNILEGKDVKDKIIFSELKEKGNKDDKERLLTMMTFLFLENSYIDGSLVALKTLASQKEETKEEKEKRLKEDSAK